MVAKSSAAMLACTL